VSQIIPEIGIMTRVNLLQMISYNNRKAFVGKHKGGGRVGEQLCVV